MKKLVRAKTGGFTLIELLVVVLIIGILSAIALPQYTQAVEKSRAAEALSNIGSFKRAVDIWKLSNPGKTKGFTGDRSGAGELDIAVPDDWIDRDDKSCSKNFCYKISTVDVTAYRWKNNSMWNEYEIEYWFRDGETPYYKCIAYSAEGLKLCKSLSNMKDVEDCF